MLKDSNSASTDMTTWQHFTQPLQPGQPLPLLYKEELLNKFLKWANVIRHNRNTSLKSSAVPQEWQDRFLGLETYDLRYRARNSDDLRTLPIARGLLRGIFEYSSEAVIKDPSDPSGPPKTPADSGSQIFQSAVANVIRDYLIDLDLITLSEWDAIAFAGLLPLDCSLYWNLCRWSLDAAEWVRLIPHPINSVQRYRSGAGFGNASDPAVLSTAIGEYLSSDDLGGINAGVSYNAQWRRDVAEVIDGEPVMYDSNFGLFGGRIQGEWRVPSGSSLDIAYMHTFAPPNLVNDQYFAHNPGSVIYSGPGQFSPDPNPSTDGFSSLIIDTDHSGDIVASVEYPDWANPGALPPEPPPTESSIWKQFFGTTHFLRSPRPIDSNLIVCVRASD